MIVSEKHNKNKFPYTSLAEIEEYLKILSECNSSLKNIKACIVNKNVFSIF